MNKSKFKVGQIVNLPVRIIQRDRRCKPPSYKIQALRVGWVLDDCVWETELDVRLKPAEPKDNP